MKRFERVFKGISNMKSIKLPILTILQPINATKTHLIVEIYIIDIIILQSIKINNMFTFSVTSPRGADDGSSLDSSAQSSSGIRRCVNIETTFFFSFLLTLIVNQQTYLAL